MKTLEPYRSDHDRATVIYDGECPVCSNLIRYGSAVRAGHFSLVDGRSEPAVVAALRLEGIEINDTFVVISKGVTYLGHDGIAELSRVSERPLLRLLFSYSALNRLTYRVMARGRRVLLMLLGKNPI